MHSAWSQLIGQYDHNAWPLAPPGIHVLVHEKPDNRKSWGKHANDAWYIGPAINHYRCFRVYMRETQSERVTDTLTWFPKHVTLPTATSTEILAAGLQDVVKELQAPTAPNSLINLTDSNRQELIDMTNTLITMIQDDDTPNATEEAASPREANQDN